MRPQMPGCDTITTYLTVTLTLDSLLSFIDRYGKPAWNRWVDREIRQGSLFIDNGGMHGSMTPPIMAKLDLSYTDLTGKVLSGLNLTPSNAEGANFTDADLSHTRLSNVQNATFTRANLTGSKFTYAISGANFEGAAFRETDFTEAGFDKTLPPVGLPNEYLSQCKLFPKWFNPPPRPPAGPDMFPIKGVYLRPA